MREVHYSERFDTQKSIIRPWVLPGGINFLIRILLWGGALMLLSYFFFGRGFLSAYMELMRDMAVLNEVAENPDATEAASLEIFSSLAGFYSALFFVGIFAWLINVSVETAMHKNMFRGEDKGMFPLRFARDELNVMITQFVILLSISGLYLGGSMVIIMVMTIGSLMGTAIGALFGVLGVLAFIALHVFIVFMFVRLSPASAYGIIHNRLVIFEMWKKTKGHGWNVFGSFLIAGLFGYLILTVIMYVGIFIIFGDAAASGLLLGSVPDNPDELFSTIAAIFNKTSVKISLGIFMIIYIVCQLLYGLHIWGVGNYTAEYIAEREESAE